MMVGMALLFSISILNTYTIKVMAISICSINGEGGRQKRLKTSVILVFPQHNALTKITQKKLVNKE